MLHRIIREFIAYCRLADFSDRSIQALTARLNEFQSYLKTRLYGLLKRLPIWIWLPSWPTTTPLPYMCENDSV